LHGGGFKDFYENSNTILQSLISSNLKRVDHIIVLGELLKDQFYCTGEFIKQKLVVVPNGLTIGINEPRGVPKVLPKNGTIQLLYLSSLIPSKGFFNVIQAMKILDTKYPNRYNLNICGSFVMTRTEPSLEVHDKDSLLNYINIQNLGSTVSYFDQVNSQEKEWQFKQAHIFLLPTSYAWEGQPLSIIEAMANSIPVISCHHKGIPELVLPDVTGIFVKPRSVNSIVDGVTKITSNESRFKNMSAEARRHYERYFKREVHLNRMIRVICNKSEV
jgi:glycosyltransferase involved in cell wall biosynthesis